MIKKMNKESSKILQNARHFRQKIFNENQSRSFIQDEIEEVILILGSSRCGSSLLYQILNRHPDIISLPGEDITYYKLFGYGMPQSPFEDDQLEGVEINYEELANEMLRDAGYFSPNEANSTQKLMRLALQWPEILPSLEKIDFKSPYYENALLKTHYESIDKNIFIEEPPFIIPKNLEFKRNSKRKILLLKSSSNVYRMNHVQMLFPKAKFHYILLNRSAEGSINGLMDGWLSSGFHSNNLDNICTLNIKNYPSKKWWKFDLPPRWYELVNSSLVEVCAHQWKIAYEYAINFINAKEFSTLQYEKFFTPDIALRDINQILKKLDLASLSIQTEFPHIMSTNKPELNRWREKKEIISPIANSNEMLAIAKLLKDLK
jgi:hypothetical protein